MGRSSAYNDRVKAILEQLILLIDFTAAVRRRAINVGRSTPGKAVSNLK